MLPEGGSDLALVGVDKYNICILRFTTLKNKLNRRGKITFHVNVYSSVVVA